VILERERDYESILECYLLDPLRRPQAFAYLRNLLVNPELLEPEKAHNLLLTNLQVIISTYFTLSIINFMSYLGAFVVGQQKVRPTNVVPRA
jgi:hypothetical protein